MRVRNFFVSNSSSSSFIVIGTSKDYETWLPSVENGVLTIGKQGTTEFGWGPGTVYGLDSRLNLCAIALKYMGAGTSDRNRELLLEVIQARHPEVKMIETAFGEESWEAYIDHQSVDTMTEMYASRESLDDFIFNTGSYIELDNDNR